MNKIIIAFDVDGTLIRNNNPDRVHGVVCEEDEPHEDIVQLLQTLYKFKNVKIVVWSAGGQDYARRWVERLGLEHYVWRTCSKEDVLELRKLVYPIIAIDDVQACELGDLNLIVRNK